MKTVILSLAAALFSAAPVLSTAVWGQCGGTGFSGDTTCASGSSCVVVNQYYSQCQPGASAPTSTASAPGPSGCSGTRTKFKLFGVNESGAEFGNNVIPGALGTDYTWPSPTSIDFFLGQGFNTFRIPFLMERVSPPSTGGLTGPFNSTYLDGLKQTVSYITGKGGFAIVDPHNFMIFNGATITSTSQFQAWWQKLAAEFKTDNNVIFDLMNEPHDIPAQTVFQLMQAAVNGVRASGATSQLILAEGTSWTGAWTWTTSGNSDAFGAIKDPNNNIAIQMHQYLDSDGSGTSPICVSDTIGAERLQAATQWLQQTGLKGFLGEIGTGNNTQCVTALQGALCEMQQAGGTWLGALWWAAGPWWGDYYQSIEPPNGDAIAAILPALKAFQ
ncbi:Endoglucanase 3 [Trametes pubescens]|uniref:cellulase n=1 Tax=Trametes pubescens TaxID=154538 RepID=A0A1M2V2E3_TRAPU|nr:Endoglucanase 3 [Trametes pubescens]